jgi:hypothetical protein
MIIFKNISITIVFLWMVRSSDCQYFKWQCVTACLRNTRIRWLGFWKFFLQLDRSEYIIRSNFLRWSRIRHFFLKKLGFWHRKSCFVLVYKYYSVLLKTPKRFGFLLLSSELMAISMGFLPVDRHAPNSSNRSISSIILFSQGSSLY